MQIVCWWAGRVFGCPIALAVGSFESTRPQMPKHQTQKPDSVVNIDPVRDWDIACTASCWPKQVTRPAQIREVGKQISLCGKRGSFFARSVGMGQEARAIPANLPSRGPRDSLPAGPCVWTKGCNHSEDGWREALLMRWAFSSRLHLSLATLGRGLKSCHRRP